MISPHDILMQHLTATVSAPATGTLAAAITTTDGLSFSVGAGQGASFRAEGVFAVKVDSESMVVTRFGDIFTVSPGGRGAFGTTPATHLISATVTQHNFYTMVGSNVAIETWPDGFGNTYPFVVIENEGGDSNTYVQRFAFSILARCFSGSVSHKECELVSGLLYDRLNGAKNQTNSAGCLQYAYASGPPVLDTDVANEWRVAELPFDIEVRATGTTGV